MLSPPKPLDEAKRLEALRQLQILDTPREERFDRLTRLAAQIMDVAVSAISLVDADRQWFKASVGLDVAQTSRDVSFCGHAILNDSPLVVADARTDERFFDNPLVLSDPRIRFYAGIPIHGPGGYRIGTICAIDQLPRTPSASQLAALSDLARIAEEEIEIAYVKEQIQQHLEYTRLYARLQSVLDGATQIAIIATDLTGRINLFNRGAERLLGYRQDEMVGKQTPMAFHLESEVAERGARLSEERGRPISGFDVFIERARQGQHDAQEWTYVHRDGRLIPVKLTVTATLDDQARINGYLGVASDLTQEKAAQRDLNNFFDASLELLCIVRFDGTFSRLNPAWSETLGYAEAELLAHPLLTFVYPADREIARQQLAQLMQGDKPTSFVNRFVSKSGEVRWLMWTASADQERGLMWATARDVTDTRESMLRLEGVLNSVLDGVITITETGEIDSVNPAVSRIFGYQESELIGHNIKMLMPEPHQSRHDGYLSRYVTTGDARVIGVGREVEGMRKDGTTFPLELEVTEVLLPNRRLFVGTTRDLTQQKAVERLKSDFISTVSHELRTPLTSIRGALGLLAGGAFGDLPEAPKNMLGIALNNSERLVRLINDILDIDKLESGMMVLNMRVQPLAPLLEQAVRENQGFAGGFHVQLVLEDCDQQAAANVDSDRLLQVTANLISNAVKFSPSGERVTVSLLRRQGNWRVSIQDHGPGLPEEFQKRMYQKFAQADSSDKRQKGGTGLGLNIAKSLLEHMEGHIGFETSMGHGTTFYFDLPAVPLDDGTPA